MEVVLLADFYHHNFLDGDQAMPETMKMVKSAFGIREGEGMGAIVGSAFAGFMAGGQADKIGKLAGFKGYESFLGRAREGGGLRGATANLTDLLVYQGRTPPKVSK
jgi:hypothetical protein